MHWARPDHGVPFYPIVDQAANAVLRRAGATLEAITMIMQKHQANPGMNFT